MMRRRFSILLLLATTVAHAEPATEPPCDDAPVDLSLWWSVSLNARHDACVANVFGFALGTGRAGALTGLQLGVLGQTASRRMHGVQLAGFYAVGGDTAGLQLSAGLAAAAGHLRGAQLASIAVAGEAAHGIQLGALGAASGDEAAGLQLGGLFAASGEALRGLQVGGIFAAAGSHLVGLQVGGIFAAAGDDLRGLQVGGVFAASGEAMRGIQAAAGFTATSRLAGLQLAGGASFTGGGTGAQLSGGFNRARGDFTGVQLALVNLGGRVDGAQVGLVNIADRAGVQLGLVNISRHATAPLGLVSVVGDGRRAIELWGGEAVPFAAAARFGTAHVYSLLGAAGDPLHDRTSWGPLGGVGLAVPISPIDLELDGVGHALIHGDELAWLTQVRLRVRVRVPWTDQLSIAAGPTWNIYVSDDDDGAGLPLGLDRRSGHVRQWPGFTAGASIAY